LKAQIQKDAEKTREYFAKTFPLEGR